MNGIPYVQCFLDETTGYNKLVNGAVEIAYLRDSRNSEIVIYLIMAQQMSFPPRMRSICPNLLRYILTDSCSSNR